jgi:cyclophilin family peptidyl-prolyl cis-trans isomerase
MVKHNFTLFCLVLFSFSSYSQKLGLGKVTKSELLETKHKTDTSAAAAILFKKAKTDFRYTEKDGFTSSTVVEVKLKIYKKEGLKWANFRIPYYIGYKVLEDEYVEIVNGYTYNLDNDKIIKTKVTGEGKFKEQINEDWEVKSVTFPNVKVGSVIELEYKFKSQNISVLPDFQYQYDIPVNYAEYKTNIPEFYIYNGIRKGFIELKMDQKVESTAQSYEAEVGLARQSRSLSYTQIATTYTASDIPALKEEDFVNNIRNYYGQLEHELTIIRYPDEKPKQMATTWEAVAKSVYDDKDFNEAVTKFNYFTNDIKSTINDITSEEERAKKIFSFLKKRMNWNGKYGYFPRRKLEIAYTEKVGNSAEINLMLVSMLKMAGLDANPVLVSTRENGFALFPNRTLFNYVIAAVKIDDRMILMDATDKLSNLNMLPIRALNWQGRLIRNDGTSEEINLMPNSNSKGIINIMANINNEGEVAGKIREQYFDYNAFVFRDKYNEISKESYIERLEKKNQGLEIGEYDVQNSLDLELPIVENYSFKSTNSVEIIGDKMYVSPFLFFETNANPFKLEAREYPVDFMFPNQERLNISLTIPEGYAIETIPQPKALALPENLGSFKYNISNNGNQIQLLYTQDLNKAVIQAEYYEALKNFFREIVTKQTEKVVLKKV